MLHAQIDKIVAGLVNRRKYVYLCTNALLLEKNLHRFQPSKLGVQYLLPIFTNAIGTDDMEHIQRELFSPGNLTTRFRSLNIDIQKRMQYLSEAE